MLKVTGRLGKSRSRDIRHKNQDMRARCLKANPELYFSHAVRAIIEEEALYNESIDYVLHRIQVSQDQFFNIQSIYMNDPKFWEALTKIDMETLPIKEDLEEMQPGEEAKGASSPSESPKSPLSRKVWFTKSFVFRCERTCWNSCIRMLKRSLILSTSQCKSLTFVDLSDSVMPLLFG